MNSRLQLVLFCCVLALYGCSTSPSVDYSKVTLIKAGGTVKLDGQPLPDAVVTFEDPEGQFSYGLTDSSGHYDLKFDSVAFGVREGRKTVRISTARKIPGLNGDEEVGDINYEQPAAAPVVERVPPKYNSATELAEEVTSTKTVYDFELASK